MRESHPQSFKSVNINIDGDDESKYRNSTVTEDLTNNIDFTVNHLTNKKGVYSNSNVVIDLKTGTSGAASRAELRNVRAAATNKLKSPYGTGSPEFSKVHENKYSSNIVIPEAMGPSIDKVMLLDTLKGLITTNAGV